MATDTPEAKAEETEKPVEGEALAVPAASDVPPKKDNFLFKAIIIAGLLMVVMGVQFLMLWMFFGGSADPSASGEYPEVPAIGDPDNPAGGSFAECEIDSFNCTNGVAAQGSTIHITFRLTVTIPQGMLEVFRIAANKDNKHRVRQAINKIMRSASQEDLKDPELDRIKMKIREDVNKILGTSYIKDVIITSYKTMEQ